MMRTDYACSGSEGEVMKGCLAKGCFQDWTRVSKEQSSRSQDHSDKGYPSEVDSRDGTREEASARTQVYLSKTKLKLQVGI